MWKNHSALFLGALGLGLEILAIKTFFSMAGSTRGMASAALVHSAASVLMAGGLYFFLPRTLKSHAWRAFVLLIVLCLFMPLVGFMGIGLVLLPALHWPRAEKRRQFWEGIEIPKLPDQPFRVSTQPLYVAVGLVGVLRHVQNVNQRLQAVMACRQISDQQAIPILNIALKDPADDVRLLAYSMLDAKEHKIYEKIKEQLQQLKNMPEGDKADIYQNLAQHFWELAYLGLAQGEVLAHVLNEAHKYASMVLAQKPESGTTYLLLGRILIRQNQYAEAEKMLHKAKDLGLPEEIVNPYLAESAFSERQFEKVQEHLRPVAAFLKNRRPMADILAYWLD